VPIYPLYAVMFVEHGISALELSLLFSIWAAVGIVLEVPSGALADALSRKWLVVASGFLKAAAFLTWFCWQTFDGYAFGFVLWGLGSTLRSGAFEALLYDTLDARGEATQFTHHFGRIRALATTAIVVGELTGGLLIVHGYDTVLLASMVMPIVASVVFMFAVTEPARGEALFEAGYLSHLRAGLGEAARNPRIRYILLAFTCLVTASGTFDEFVNPVMFEAGFSLQAVALVSAGIALAEAIAVANSGRFAGLGTRALLGIMAAAAICLGLLPNLGGAAVPIALAVFFALFGLAGTVFAGRLQHEIEGNSRATVTSAASLGEGVGGIAWFLAFGAVAEATDMMKATIAFAGATLLLCMAFYRGTRAADHHQAAGCDPSGDDG